MADAQNRLNVFPSRMTLAAMKDKLKAAGVGLSLLKKKSDAIKINLNEILKKILDVKRRLGGQLREAAFSHTEATWAAGSFNHQVIENASNASFRVKPTIKNVAGVKLPIFNKIENEGTAAESMVGLSKGGAQVQKCRKMFLATLEDLVLLASLQTSLKTLDEALKVTNRRVNALEFVIMPKLANTVSYIMSELDELEREDNFRIKKVKDLRQREEDAKRDEDKALEAAAAAQAAEGGVLRGYDENPDDNLAATFD